jgi:guanylate cyclase, other
MKEMRLLRDLRHDNINSFIGACVEPMRILLVTDYCAKGSLYDIIENEDIKLDELFIASLVHDLIKVSSEFLSFFFLLFIEIKTLSAGHELYS